MKKTLFTVTLCVFASYLLMAQPSCTKDVEYTLVIQNEVPKARKMMEEQCFPGNESSPEVWLLRANVFIKLHQYEVDRKAKDAKYAIRWPDAIITANESFYKALELKPDIKGTNALLDPKDGQLISAPIIHDLAAKAMEKKDYNEAIKLLNMVIRSYRVNPKENARYLGYAYIDLANCYKATGDEANYKKILLDAVKLNTGEPNVYLNLYDLYKQEKDTVKCGEILTQARKIIPDAEAINIKSTELDYFAMIGDTAKLKSAAIKMFEQYKTNVDVIILIATHLINTKDYSLAEEMIKTGLEMAPTDFDMNQLMGYRFYREALDYVKIMEELKTQKKYTPALEFRAKYMETFKLALPWAEKAYTINSEDRDNNKMLSEIYVRLEMEVPAELNEKVNSYNKQ